MEHLAGGSLCLGLGCLVWNVLNRSIWPHGMISFFLTMIPECEGGCPRGLGDDREAAEGHRPRSPPRGCAGDTESCSHQRVSVLETVMDLGAWSQGDSPCPVLRGGIAELKGERVWCEKDLSLKSSDLFGTSMGRE